MNVGRMKRNKEINVPRGTKNQITFHVEQITKKKRSVYNEKAKQFDV